MPAAPPNCATSTRGFSSASRCRVAVEPGEPHRRLVAEGDRQRVLQMGAPGHRRVAVAPRQRAEMAAHRVEIRLDQLEPVADLQHRGGVHDVLRRRAPMQPAPAVAGPLGQLAHQRQDRVADGLGLAPQPRRDRAIAGSPATAAAACEIASAASAGTMPSRAWARASAASTSAQRARNASSPNTARIAAVPNMSPNRVDDRTPMRHLAFACGRNGGIPPAKRLPVARSPAAPAPGSAPCRPFSGSRRSSSRDRHRAGPGGGIPRPATGSTSCRGCRGCVRGS